MPAQPIYPNLECYYLASWMLDVSPQRLTGSQITVAQAIQAAALNNTSVTENEWNNFNLFAAWRNPYYLVYRDYQIASVASLNTGLVHYYKFEGNSNDSVGGVNGVDTLVSYSLSYGKVGQGVRNNGSSSSIVFGNNTTFNFIHQTLTFSINFWLRFATISTSAAILGSTTSFSEKGFYFAHSSSSFELINIPDGSGNPYATLYSILYKIIANNSWHMVTITGDGTNVFVYIDGAIRFKGGLGNVIAGNATNAMALFKVSATGTSQLMDIDELGFWTRALNQSEIGQLFNSGAGITYPFV